MSLSNVTTAKKIVFNIAGTNVQNYIHTISLTKPKRNNNPRVDNNYRGVYPYLPTAELSHDQFWGVLFKNGNLMLKIIYE